MIVTYLRSSSYNTHEWCPHKYFCGSVLGMHQDSNKKADKGTIVHKVMEILALARKAELNGEDKFYDDILGWSLVAVKDDIELVFDKVFGYYTGQFTQHSWSMADYRECLRWCNKALAYNNGEYDPRQRNIIEAEMHFDFEIRKRWAKYSYTLDGKKYSGFLSMKGTIDLLTRNDDGIIEAVDWKTGRRLNWAKGTEKDYKSLREDPQLRMYHYAINRLFPDEEIIIFTINYINDGGAFSIPFEKRDLIKTEEMIKEKFLDISRTTRPKLVKSWKCNKICHFGKNLYPGTDDTICEHIRKEIIKKGIQGVTEEYMSEGHSLDKYKAPGEV